MKGKSILLDFKRCINTVLKFRKMHFKSTQKAQLKIPHKQAEQRTYCKSEDGTVCC